MASWDARSGKAGGVSPAPRRGFGHNKGPIWLLIEEQADGKVKYAFSNLPEGTSLRRAVRLWKSRWPVEQSFRDYKAGRGVEGEYPGRRGQGLRWLLFAVMVGAGGVLWQGRPLRGPTARAAAGAADAAPQPAAQAGEPA